ncbi:MAG: hypothetical protein WAN22_20945 [Solirubrobacteraceae bacterium]
MVDRVLPLRLVRAGVVIFPFSGLGERVAAVFDRDVAADLLHDHN